MKKCVHDCKNKISAKSRAKKGLKSIFAARGNNSHPILKISFLGGRYNINEQHSKNQPSRCQNIYGGTMYPSPPHLPNTTTGRTVLR